MDEPGYRPAGEFAPPEAVMDRAMRVGRDLVRLGDHRSAMVIAVGYVGGAYARLLDAYRRLERAAQTDGSAPRGACLGDCCEDRALSSCRERMDGAHAVADMDMEPEDDGEAIESGPPPGLGRCYEAATVPEE